MKDDDSNSTRCSPPVDAPTYAVMVSLREIRLAQVPAELRNKVYTLLKTVFCPTCG